VALHHHAERVADEDDVDAGRADEARRGGVIGGDDGDLLAGLLHPAKIVHGDALPRPGVGRHGSLPPVRAFLGVPPIDGETTF
jgi:hypothetical protein